MSVRDNEKNRGAHGDSSFMLGRVRPSSENPPALAVGSVKSTATGLTAMSMVFARTAAGRFMSISQVSLKMMMIFPLSASIATSAGRSTPQIAGGTLIQVLVLTHNGRSLLSSVVTRVSD